MKQYSCPVCGRQKFILVKTSGTLVDFTREGAIEGYPHLSNIGEDSRLFKCDGCGVTIPNEQAQEMLKGVL